MRSARVIDVSGGNDTGPFKALYVGGTGNINLTTKNGETVLFSAIPAGTIIPIEGEAVLQASTTATLIVALND